MIELPYEMWRHILSFNTLPLHSTLSSMFYDIEIDLEEERKKNILSKYSYLEDIIDNEDMESLLYITYKNIFLPYRTIDYSREDIHNMDELVDMKAVDTVLICQKHNHIDIAIPILYRLAVSTVFNMIIRCISDNNTSMLGIMIDNNICPLYSVLSMIYTCQSANLSLFKQLSSYGTLDMSTYFQIEELRKNGDFLF
jgi:hypothetical protein